MRVWDEWKNGRLIRHISFLGFLGDKHDDLVKVIRSVPEEERGNIGIVIDLRRVKGIVGGGRAISAAQDACVRKGGVFKIIANEKTRGTLEASLDRLPSIFTTEAAAMESFRA